MYGDKSGGKKPPMSGPAFFGVCLVVLGGLTLLAFLCGYRTG